VTPAQQLSQLKLMLAGGKVEDVIRLVVPHKDSPGSAEEQKRHDACGNGTYRAARREYDSAPDCRS
jgi:hypothetical protein